MSFDPASIQVGAQVKAPRIQIIATEGFGKTSFAACYTNRGKDKTEDTDKCLIIPIGGETGADGLDVDKTPAVNTYQDLIAICDYFIENDSKYERIVFDSTSAIEPIINNHICTCYNVDNVRKVKGFRVGEMAIENCWHELLGKCDLLRNKGIEIVFVTHTKVKGFNDPENERYDRYVADLEEPNAAILHKWCDIIGFGKVDLMIRKEDAGFGNERVRAEESFDRTRYISFEPTATRPGKRRSEFSNMPDKVELDHLKFKEAMIASVQKTINT